VSEETTLHDLSEALDESKGATPQEVVDAFLNVRTVVAGQPLVPLTAGHDLFLAKFRHPILKPGSDWTPQDVATALFAFSRSSRDLFAMIEDGIYEAEFFGFLDTIPMGEIAAAAAAIVAHWLKSRATSLPMKSPDNLARHGVKKKAASGGGSKRSRQLAKNTAGSRNS
jgi:hypothetical protein